jgi:hypothetical protein
MTIRRAKKASGNALFLSLGMLAAATGMTVFVALDEPPPVPDIIHPFSDPIDSATDRIQVAQTTPNEQSTLGNSYVFPENDDNSPISSDIYPVAQPAGKTLSLDVPPFIEKTSPVSFRYSGKDPHNSVPATRTVKSPLDATEDSETSISFRDRTESASRMRKELTSRKRSAWVAAQTQGWSPVGSIDEDSGYELMAIENGSVYTYETCNRDAAISTAADEAIAGAPVPLDGDTQTAGVWDQGGVLSSHQEFGDRVTVRDGAYPSSHATHVGGTIAAQGVTESAVGMAPGAQIASYDWSNDLAEMTEEAMSYDGEPGTLQVSSHSYGFVSGWALSYSPPRWYGNAGETEAANFGLYDWYAEKWDELCHNAPYFLPFKSAGNNRIDHEPPAGTNYRYYDNGWITKPYDPSTDPAGDGTANGGYDTIPLLGNAKNVMTVGAVDDAVANGERSLAPAAMMQFSGWGPSDDGRIKPDIVANGALIYSARATSDSAYGSMSGTSMATPNAAGSALLLLDLHQKLFDGSTMPASLLKGLILHTADDLGNPGPDYMYGWGIMNTKAAADLIEQHHDQESMKVLTVDSISEGETKRYSFISDGRSPLRATICWTDPPGESTYDLDDRSERLVHNLDLRITGPDEIVYRPYILDPENPGALAESGDNNVDNVEQVVVSETPEGGTFEITVVADGSLARGSQEFALIVSGMAGAAGSAPEVSLNPWVDVATDGSGFSSISGEITDGDDDVCELEVEYTTDGSTWYHAEIADASCAAGPLPVDNRSETQVAGLTVSGDTHFNLTWDSRNSESPVEISKYTRIRVRAWDGTQWSDWSVSSHFEIDNVAPETGNAEFVSASRAFGRYTLESAVQIAWIDFEDEGSGIAEYLVGINSAHIEDASEVQGASITVTELELGEEATIYVRARDGAGNISDPIFTRVFVLNPDGNWEIRSEIAATGNGASSSGTSSSESPVRVEMSMTAGKPVLRWQYESGVDYVVERCSSMGGDDFWQDATDHRFTIDGSWVVWVTSDTEFLDDPTGFFRVIARPSISTEPPVEEPPIVVQPPKPDGPSYIPPSLRSYTGMIYANWSWLKYYWPMILLMFY